MRYIPKLRFPEFSGEWEEKKLGECLTLLYGKDWKDKSSTKKLYPVLGTGGVISYIDEFIYDKPCVLIGRKGSINNPVFIDKPFWTVDTQFYSEIHEGYSPKFLYYIFCTENWSKHDESTGVPSLSAKNVENTHKHIPSYSEQQKIADFLSNVDSIITAETKILNTLQKKKKALMRKLFTRQLRFKSADGKDFPAWEEKKLREISSSPKYGLNASGIDYDGEHKYLRITDIDEVTHTFSPEEITTPSEFSDEYLLEENDIVFARTGASTGKTYLYNPNDGDLYFAGFLIKFHIKDANARFVFYQTCTHEYEKWVHVMSTRSGQPGINSEEYSTLKIKLPCIEEQQKIADCLSSLDSLIQTQQKVVTTWQQRKKALLQQMFV